MKTRFNYFTVFTLILFLGAAPMAVFAAPPVGKSATSTKTDGTSFCAEIDSLSAKILTSISEQEKNYNKKGVERMKELTDRRISRDVTENTRRSIWDENRGEHFKLLEAKAKTSAEKKAVAAFKPSIETAVAARKGKVDSAHAAFRVAADKALRERSSTFNTATSTFKGAVDRAALKAKTECKAKQSSEAAREVFRSALKDARMTFENSVKNLSQFSVDSASKVRNSALDKAQKDFTVDVDTALKILKSAAPKI